MIKWGIIGPGTIAHKFADEVCNTEHGKLISVYGRNEERTKNFAKGYNLETYYTDIDQFLNAKEIDAVYIATPHSSHMKFARQCIKAGKHVLCEKPFSYNEKTSREILELAKENNVFVMEALWTLFLPAVKKAKSWIEEGRIGKVKLITANFGFKSEEDINSRLYNPELAGGALLDVGIYTILISNFITNSMPEKVNASAVMTKTNVDETDMISLKYGNGECASLTCSIACDTENSAVIYGDNGKIVVPEFSKAKKAYLYSNKELLEQFEDKYDGTGYKYEIEEANSCILGDKLESQCASHKMTLELAEIMDEVREQINLVYPFE
ncbi:MAG: Gfo/Idh/MocA family oxidoreductase [Clostridium sp.]|nr:Gfo/Idh/MocA family oxidoreductase [Clostridium sp.]